MYLTNNFNVMAEKSKSDRPFGEATRISERCDSLHKPSPDDRCVVDRLPTELLVHTFYLGLVDALAAFLDVLSGIHREQDTSTGPELPFEVIVSHVCRRWREVALTTPALWAQVAITSSTMHSKTQAYLARAKTVAVDITIDLKSPSTDVSALVSVSRGTKKQIAQMVFEHWLLLSPSISHWRTFALRTANSLVMHAFLIALHCCSPAPMLENLVLADKPAFVSHLHRHEWPLCINPFFLNAPKLSKAILSGVYFNWPQTGFAHALTTLELSNHQPGIRPSYQDLARILRESPSLKALTLKFSGPTGGPADWGVDTYLDIPEHVPESCRSMLWSQSVARLTLDQIDEEYAAELIDRLALPSLTRLEIDIVSGDCTGVLEALIRPRPPDNKSLLAGLTDLRLKQFRGGDARVIVEAYGAMPNLTTFWFGLDICSPLWLSLLSHKDVLPRLRNLVPIAVTGWQLRALISKRQEWGAPLWTVVMAGSPELGEEDRRWLTLNTHIFMVMPIPESAGIPVSAVGVDVADEDDWTDGNSDDGSDEYWEDNW